VHDFDQSVFPLAVANNQQDHAKPRVHNQLNLPHSELRAVDQECGEENSPREEKEGVEQGYLAVGRKAQTMPESLLTGPAVLDLGFYFVHLRFVEKSFFF